MNESNGIITLMRGDSFSFPVYINEGSIVDPEYRGLTVHDVIYFGVMEPGQAFEDAVLKKRVNIEGPLTTDGQAIINITPDDTLNLLVGKYYYMIKLKTVDEYGLETVRTLVKPTLFWLEGNNRVYNDNISVQQITNSIDRVIFDGGEII